MNLILQAINALFRKVENRTAASVTTLTKKITTAQNTASAANKTAVKAQNTANKALDLADSAKLPIFRATSTDGVSYRIETDGFVPRNGELLVVIPDKRNIPGKYLKVSINGKWYSVNRTRSDGSTVSFAAFEDAVFVEDRPMLLLMSDTEVYFADINLPNVTSGYAVCEEPSYTVAKLAVIGSHTGEAGSTAFVVFTNGNAASNPKLMIKNGVYMPIVDRTGAPIGTDAIKAGYLHQFVSDGSNWILVD